MALHPNFPPDPYAVLEPDHRWFPGAESLCNTDMKNLTPPLVAQIRRRVKEFRDDEYAGASETSRSLLRWWFIESHLVEDLGNITERFEYYFAQREAIESIIYLCDVVGARNQYDLMRFDVAGAVSNKDFPETWRRYVVKMATGAAAQSNESGFGVELLSQVIRTELGIIAQLFGYCSQYHCAGSSLQGFSGFANFLRGPGVARQWLRWAQLAG